MVVYYTVTIAVTYGNIWYLKNCIRRTEGKVYLHRRFLQYVFLQYVFLQKCNFAMGIFAITKIPIAKLHCQSSFSNHLPTWCVLEVAQGQN